MPRILFSLPGMLMIHKPPGWEITLQRVVHTRCFSLWLQGALSNVPCLESHAGGNHLIGLIHRLDVPCSGLLLVAQTYESAYFLKRQLHTCALVRDYAVHCFDWMPFNLCAIDALLFHSARKGITTGAG